VLEAALVIGGVTVLGTLAFLVASLPPLTLMWGSVAVIGLGCVIGIPTGVAYHIVLHRELARIDRLTPGWVWRPIQQHVHLDEGALSRVRPWFWSGGISFLVICLGFSLLTLTLATHFR
jgi:hypothetical protein